MTAPLEGKSPLDLSELPTIEATPVEDLAGIVAKARAAQEKWAELRLEDRIRAVSRAKAIILKNAEVIAKAIHDEVGKPEVEAILGEVLPSADVVGYWTETILDALEPIEAELDSLSYPGKSGWTHRVPRGTILLIQPWNFPFALPIRAIIPALLAGNAIVFKPSEVSPRSSKLIVDLLAPLLPEGLLGLVLGGRDVGQTLLDADIDAVAFTGSVATGKTIAKHCAERLLPCSLELGGKDAAIVLADANLDRAAKGIAWAALSTTGQSCAAVERVYVEESVAKAFEAKLVSEVKSLRYGTDYGPLATAKQRTLVADHVTSAKEKGGEVLCGGSAKEEGYGYEATVIRVPDDTSTLMQDETFGPVIPIAVVKDEAEAIRRANGTRYGLTASVWTKDTRRGERIAQKLRAGVVTVNNHSFTGALPQAPWSGVGETGSGITNSHFALDFFTRPRFVLVDKNGAKREVWWFPYTPVLAKIALAFARLRGGGTLGERISAFFVLLGALPKRLGGKDA